MDKTSFWWTQNCSICHPGGGPAEFDRDGEKYYDVATGEFGYERLGKVAGEVTLDGDYALIDTKTGQLQVAPWDKTGVSEADCLFCHRADRVIDGGTNMNWVWRTATLKGGSALVDGNGDPVAAFAAAPASGQGWLSDFETKPPVPGMPPVASRATIDYGVGVADGSLLEHEGMLWVSGLQIQRSPKDYACWGCHLTPDLKKRGRQWFDPDRDVHYRAFNHLDDGDAANDIAPEDSTACTVCHPADAAHNIAKGNATLGSVANETDYQDFRTCRDCHLPGALKHPDAPEPPSATVHSSTHLGVLSCEACHVPYKTLPAQLVVDNSVTGSSIGYDTDAFLSADPLDPGNVDKSRWYPDFVSKTDRDGVARLFPVKLLLSMWWGDWDDKGTPGDLSDDIIRPIPLWRVRGITGGNALPGVTDDTGDGIVEVNRLAEIKLYIDALKGNDLHGNPVATRPVLVKGGRVWFEEAGAPDGVGSFEYEGTGIRTESSHPFSINHNVLDGAEALGSVSCGECHETFNFGLPTRVFDRLTLVDPFDADGNPVWETVRERTGVSPP